MVAPDKFRGTATARELCDTMSRAVQRHSLTFDAQPMSDGGEGFSDTFPGDVVWVRAHGPLGEPITARITLSRGSRHVLGVIEVADVIGRDRLPHATSSQALAASSQGVGHLVMACQDAGVDAIVVGCGGSSTSDGGLGCYHYLRDHGGLRVPTTVATDITARFSGALRYAPQKGVYLDDLGVVRHRLDAARQLYLDDTGVDVETIERTGAAGGIAGALTALGATPTSGVGAVATAVSLIERMARASLVITGEGRFDEGSLEGKVTLSVAEMLEGDQRLVMICGAVDEAAATSLKIRFPQVALFSLSDLFGETRALHDTLGCVDELVDSSIEDWVHRGA